METLWTRAGLTWKEFGLRLWRQIWEDEVLGRCAELAYFFLFSVFPLLLFLTTLLGYLTETNPALRLDLMTYLIRISPSADVSALLTGTLQEITTARTGTKLWLSLTAAIWIASNGMIAVGRTLNTAYGFKETRRWWKRRIIAVILTLTFAVLIVGALALIFYGGTIANTLAELFGHGSFFATAWRILQWPLILVFLLISFDLVYNYAPNLSESFSRQWGTPGAVTGVTLFLLVTFGLRLYLVYFRNFTTAYGSLGAVILLLVWFYLAAFGILMGGEVNSEIGRELASQRGEERPRPNRQRRRFLSALPQRRRR